MSNPSVAPPLGRSCSLHRFHRPLALTTENHHVIPQAWQHFALGREALFDERVVAVAPTCHRNVHYWLVQFMKSLDSPTPKWPTAEAKMALLGMQRYRESGRSLDDLAIAKLWGGA